MAENIKNLGKVCITPEGVWDVNKEYDRLSLVVTTDVNTQRVLSYVSRKHVPKGNINIKDTEYWQLFTTELKLEDITIDENGNVKIGDVVIYQIPLGDALGEIVVNKIKHDLTDYIMTEIRSYMTSMVQELINSFSNQIGRLISEGIKIDNNVNGTMHNVDEITHYGNINLKHDGKISGILSGSVNTKLSGEVYINGDEPTPSTKYVVTINADPSDAVVTLNGIEGSSAEFDEGSTVIVVVSKSGYVTKTETITNIQQDTILNITLVAEGVQYFFRVNPTQKLVGASSSEFSIAVDSVKNNQRYDYEYEIEDVDGIIQSIVKETGGVKIITTANALDRQKNATIYFKQYRPEEEVLHVNIPLVITQETDNPSEYIFTSERINRFNRDSSINGLGAFPVGMGEYTTTDYPGIPIISTVNGNPCDYDVDAPSWFEIVDKDLINNRCQFKFNKVTSETEGTITLTQRNSGKTLSFKILRINNLLYVINNPFTFDNKGHNEKLRVISCYNSSGSGSFYIDCQPALDENDNHPDWINISSEDFENARLISHGGYPTSSYFDVPIKILVNRGAERNGVVKITNDTNKKYDIIIKQEGNVLEEYTFEFPNPSDNLFDFTNESGNSIEHDIDSYKVTGGITNVLGFNIAENLPNWLNIEAVNNNSKVKVTIADNAPKVTNQKYTLQQIDSGSLTGETLEIYITTKDSPTPTIKYTVTVNPTPSDALVTLNDGLNPGEFDAGTDVRVFVSKYGYIAHEETITNLQENKTLNITLKQETDEFYAAQTDMRFTLDGGQLPNTIVSLKNGSFIGYVLTSKPEWTTVTLDYEGDQNRINVVVGNTSSARSGNIVLTQNETGNTLTIGVSQNNTYELNVVAKSFNIVSGGEQKSTLYTSTLNGNYVDPIVTPSDNWITYQLLSNGNNHYIQITVAENTATSQRTGTISVVNGDKSETINITQDAAPAQDTYEFSSDKQSLSFAAADGSQQTAKVTSTKNGSRIDTSIDSKPGWITVNQVIDETGTNYLFTAAANSSTESRSGNIVVKQQRGSSFETITIAVTQEGSSAPPTPTYELVGILSRPTGDYEQDLTTAIRLTTADNSVTLTPRVKINGQLRTDVDVNILYDGFSQGAHNTDKFKVESDGMLLTISTLGEEPSEPISTSYDITVRYDGNTESFTFEIDWDI